jgi:hypothetical protein
MKRLHRCWICSEQTEIPSNYRDHSCGFCGQQYEYDEKKCIVLDDEQIQALLMLKRANGEY